MFATLSSALLLQTEIHEYYVRVRHPIIGWLLIGLIAGWLAGKLSRGRGFFVHIRMLEETEGEFDAQHVPHRFIQFTLRRLVRTEDL